ncbi:MAG: hypothetical protein AAGU32_00275 [Bacillota bacterium]
MCDNRTQHKELCDGPSTYRAEKVNQVVNSILSGIFFRAKGGIYKIILGTDNKCHSPVL